MPAYEDKYSTYTMNSKALRAVQHVEHLVNIEGQHEHPLPKNLGRSKSRYRAAVDTTERNRDVIRIE